MPVVQPIAEPRDVVYVYDGSISGFLCCVYESVCARELPLAVFAQNEIQPTLWPQKDIGTDEPTARKVRSAIQKKISPRALELTENVLFSCMREKEIQLLRFLLRGFALGGKITGMLGDPVVAPLLKAERHLLGERHLLLGFVRFSDCGGALTATITPKNFILPYIAGHFISRFSGEDFLIYDQTHSAALIYQDGKKQIVRAEGFVPPSATKSELYYRSLWKQFYDTIAIEARENPRCRMSHMPKRYWENMVEMQDQI